MRIAGMGVPIGLDFGSIMQVGAALGTDVALLADVLPTAEATIVASLNQEGEDG